MKTKYFDLKTYLDAYKIDYVIDNDNLTIGGYLDLRGTNISALPDNLTVRGGLDLSDTNISALPDNLTVGGWLDLHGTNISALPDNLTVGGELDLSGTNISALPDNLTVGGSLYLSGTNISALPDNLTVGGSLDLRGTNISALPDNLTVGGDLDLSGTNISALPDNLTVGGDLDLRDTNIKSKKINKPSKKFMRSFANEVESKLCWQNGKYRKIDGIFCEIISAKRNILKIKIGLKTAYIFFKDNVYAHGNTVRQAYFDWLFKTSERDVSQYKGLNSDEVHDLSYWVIAYRTITGACSFGTNEYLENNKDKYKDKMTLTEVLKATEGQYGYNIFKDFSEHE